jgi:hypothetical protein
MAELRLGGVYRFNRAVAQIETLTPINVYWLDLGTERRRYKRPALRGPVPRWFFAKYATPHLQSAGHSTPQSTRQASSGSE